MSKGYILDKSLYFDIALYLDIFDDESGSTNYGDLNISFVIRKHLLIIILFLKRHLFV